MNGSADGRGGPQNIDNHNQIVVIGMFTVHGGRQTDLEPILWFFHFQVKITKIKKVANWDYFMPVQRIIKQLINQAQTTVIKKPAEF
jgi:hypothetical protein